ncbi:MAG: CotH kinase family protein [Erysipelotrichaceae bacterium]
MKIEKNKLRQNSKLLIMILLVVFLIMTISIFLSQETASRVIDKENLGTEEIAIGKLVINEVNTSNNGAITDPNGIPYEYVELYNGSNQDINLLNYGLSDKEKEIKWVFPETTIKANGYALIYLSGKAQDGLYANFKLSSAGGEKLSLRAPSGKVVDVVETQSLSNNEVLARNHLGKWVVFDHCTPGFENNQAGLEAFLASLKTENKTGLIISEFLPNNKGNVSVNGNYYGYIELTNTSSGDINLENYSLSNSLNYSFKWQFKNYSLSSGKSVVVYTSGKSSYDDVLESSFKLTSNNGEVVLADNKGKVIDYQKYENIPNGLAAVLINDKFVNSINISPGYSNDVAGITAFNNTRSVRSDLIISEVCNNNTKYVVDNGNNFYDFIEIKNISNKDINIKDYYLSNTDNELNKYQLPDITLKAKGSYVILASGNTTFSNSKYQHANFKIGDVEGIFLTKNSQIVDAIAIGNMLPNYSIGKSDQGKVYYYQESTPAENNNSGSVGISDPVINLSTAGVYNNINDLTIQLMGKGTIYYTLNGEWPTDKSDVYTGPFSINKTTTIRYMQKESDMHTSKVVTDSYILNENPNIDVLALAIDEDDLNRLHRNAGRVGYEIGNGSMELFENNKKVLSAPMGLQLFGGSARSYAKKSYEVVFKKEYGEGHIEYPVFNNRDYRNYQSLVLRTGSQDDEFAVIRDVVATSLMDEFTDVATQAYRPVSMYINGEYWGLYFIREKVDEHFITNNYNVDGTQSNLIRIDGDIKVGDKKQYNELVSFASKYDLNNADNYAKLQTMIDIDSVIDFWIGESYLANNDIVNCRFFNNPALDGGKFKYIFYDLDFAWYNSNHNYFSFATAPGGISEYGFDNTLLREMMSSKLFRQRFLERLKYNLDNTWKKENIIKRIEDIENKLDLEMQKDRPRWNFSYKNWKGEVDKLIDFVEKRDKTFRTTAKSYFRMSSEEYQQYLQ